MSNEIIYDTLKGLSGLRKVLAEAQKQAMMAADDMENTQYNSGSAINAVEGGADNLDKAIEAIMGIATYIGKAITLSEAAKSALREINLPDQPESAGLPEASPAGAIPQAAPSLAAQRAMFSRYRNKHTSPARSLSQQRGYARKLRERSIGG